MSVRTRNTRTSSRCLRWQVKSTNRHTERTGQHYQSRLLERRPRSRSRTPVCVTVRASDGVGSDGLGSTAASSTTKFLTAIGICTRNRHVTLQPRGATPCLLRPTGSDPSKCALHSALHTCRKPLRRGLFHSIPSAANTSRFSCSRNLSTFLISYNKHNARQC